MNRRAQREAERYAADMARAAEAFEAAGLLEEKPVRKAEPGKHFCAECITSYIGNRCPIHGAS